MNRIFAFSLVFLATFLGAFGNTYRGTLTQTITATNDPLYQVGRTFVGCFQYETDSIDGTFNALQSYSDPAQPGVNYTLDGVLYTPFATSVAFNYEGNPYQINGPGGSFTDFRDTPTNAGELVVENGDVANFSWSFEHDGFFMWTNGTSFSALSGYGAGPSDQWLITSGTVTFGKPVNVPDATATLPLLVGALFVLGLIRRHFVTQGISFSA